MIVFRIAYLKVSNAAISEQLKITSDEQEGLELALGFRGWNWWFAVWGFLLLVVRPGLGFIVSVCGCLLFFQLTRVL